MKDKIRLNCLVWVITVSVGYFGIKGGIFTILTGGNYKVWGPPQSNLEDNNALALAILMVIPLMIYLANVIDVATAHYRLQLKASSR